MKVLCLVNKCFALFLIGSTSLFLSCNRDTVEEPANEPELVTTVYVSINNLDKSDGDASATYFDPDGPGGEAATVEPIILEAGYNYAITALFYDDSDPENPVSINRVVAFEDQEHQVCYITTGAMPTPVPQDMDDNGDPLGVQSLFSTTESGSGAFKVVLRHLPDKSADDPCSTGKVDVQTLSFPVTIN